jgi:hypothetical protein
VKAGLSGTIVGNQHRLTVEVVAKIEGWINTLPLMIQTKWVFDGKKLLWNAWIHAAFRASAGLLNPDGKSRHEQEKYLDAYRRHTA